MRCGQPVAFGKQRGRCGDALVQETYGWLPRLEGSEAQVKFGASAGWQMTSRCGTIQKYMFGILFDPVDFQRKKFGSTKRTC